MELSTQLGQYSSIAFDKAFQLSQNIPFPSLFGAKKALNQAEVELKIIDKSLSINELSNQVRSYYYQIQFLENNAVKLQYLDSLYADFIRIATLRYSAGDTKKVDISITETKRGEIGILIQQNAAFIQDAYNNLAYLLKTKEVFQVEKPDSYTPLILSSLLESPDLNDHPKVQTLYQEAKIAEQSKKVERAQGLPDLTVSYTNQSLIGFQTVDGQEKFFGGGKRFQSVNIGIGIPLTYGATKARIKALELQKRSAENAALYQKDILQTDFNNALLRYQQARKEYDFYTKTALPNSDQIVRASRLGYSAGEISYVEYLYVLETTVDVQLKYLATIQAINQSIVDIKAITNQ